MAAAAGHGPADRRQGWEYESKQTEFRSCTRGPVCHWQTLLLMRRRSAEAVADVSPFGETPQWSLRQTEKGGAGTTDEIQQRLNLWGRAAAEWPQQQAKGRLIAGI